MRAKPASRVRIPPSPPILIIQWVVLIFLQQQYNCNTRISPLRLTIRWVFSGFFVVRKMSKAEILAFIQSLYPGQVVLYSDQLARLIGKTEKALSELINRGTLPFKPKLLGGRRCVDIFTVAEWLNTDALLDGAIPEAPLLKPTKKPTEAKLRKSLASDLMKMRYEAANAMSRFAPNLADEVERGFLLELVDEFTQMCFSISEPIGCTQGLCTRKS